MNELIQKRTTGCGDIKKMFLHKLVPILLLIYESNVLLKNSCLPFIFISLILEKKFSPIDSSQVAISHECLESKLQKKGAMNQPLFSTINKIYGVHFWVFSAFSPLGPEHFWLWGNCFVVTPCLIILKYMLLLVYIALINHIAQSQG